MNKLAALFYRLWHTRAGNRLLVALTAVLLMVSAAVYTVLSENGALYIPCAFSRFTGWHCPGCGTTRMLQALLHGDIGRALYYNPLMLAVTLMVAGGLLWMGLRTFRKQWKPARFPRATGLRWLALPAIVLVFWVLRNTPWYRMWLF